VSARPKLLFLCQALPYPLDGGVWIRTHHVLRLLSRAFDVTALCFERMGISGTRDRRDVDEALSVLRRFGDVEAFPVPQTGRRARFLWDHLRSTLRGRVYTEYLYDSTAFRGRLESLLAREHFDLVHVDSMDLAGYLPLLEPQKTVCVHHNVESALLRRRSRFERGVVASRYYAFQAGLMERVERDWVPRLALNVMVSDEDRRELQALAGDAHYCVVENGVDIDEFQPRSGATAGAAYIGGTNWFPNLDALEFFGEEILPYLRKGGFDQPVRWVGSASPEQQKEYDQRWGIELTGYVDDVRESMQEALCHIVPLRAGGGTRLKILNSWAMGKPVVSTSIGCEGLDAQDDQNILIRDDPRDFADAILSLSRNAELCSRLGEAGRRTAEQVYSWEVIGGRMIQSYLELLSPGT